MKTVGERVKELFDKWVSYRDTEGEENDCEGRALCDVVVLLKEQDRITRQACAEATIKLARTVSQCSTVGYCKSYNDAIISAHDACLNVKAV